MFKFCSTTARLSTIHCFYITHRQLELNRESFKNRLVSIFSYIKCYVLTYHLLRFLDVKTFPGTRTYHQFIPLTTRKVGAKRTSEQIEISVAFDLVTDRNLKRKTSHLMVGDHVACVYDDDWYIGVIEITCEEECDIQIKFLHPKDLGKPVNCFYWPSVEDVCYIPENDILRKISEPIPQATERVKYQITPNDAKEIIRDVELRTIRKISPNN